jgi:hypothetical protein
MRLAGAGSLWAVATDLIRATNHKNSSKQVRRLGNDTSLSPESM